MKSLLTERKTIAWFTLAECVSRGERERAFGVYRLLSHSLDDRALALQLEGDLFCAFKMSTEALEKYDKAMRLYKQSGKLLEAAAVCEHMRILEPDNSLHMQHALELYGLLQFEDRVAELLVALVVKFVQQGLCDAACALAPLVHELHSYGKQGFCYESVVAALSQMHEVPVHVRILYAQKAAAAYIQHGVNDQLKQFMANLRAHDTEAYHAAVKLVKDPQI